MNESESRAERAVHLDGLGLDQVFGAHAQG